MSSISIVATLFIICLFYIQYATASVSSVGFDLYVEAGCGPSSLVSHNLVATPNCQIGDVRTVVFSCNSTGVIVAIRIPANKCSGQVGAWLFYPFGSCLSYMDQNGNAGFMNATSCNQQALGAPSTSAVSTLTTTLYSDTACNTPTSAVQAPGGSGGANNLTATSQLSTCVNGLLTLWTYNGTNSSTSSLFYVQTVLPVCNNLNPGGGNGFVFQSLRYACMMGSGPSTAVVPFSNSLSMVTYVRGTGCGGVIDQIDTFLLGYCFASTEMYTSCNSTFNNVAYFQPDTSCSGTATHLTQPNACSSDVGFICHSGSTIYRNSSGTSTTNSASATLTREVIYFVVLASMVLVGHYVLF